MHQQFANVPSRTFKPGDVIIRQGDPATGEAYLVHEGAVKVSRQSTAKSAS
jgi:CRP-like cAMP-binding protein